MGALSSIKSAVGLATRDGERVVPAAVASAQANLDGAQAALRAASFAVDDVAARFPGVADRRWIAGLAHRPGSPELNAEFDRAIATETAAKVAVDLALEKQVRARRVVDLAGGRATLRVAIGEAAAARAVEGQATAVVARAREFLMAAERRLLEAAAAVASAKATQAERMVSAAASGADLVPGQSLRVARLQEADAADEVESARKALAAVEGRADQPAILASAADKKIARAIQSIMLSELPRLKAKVVEAAEAHYRQALALKFAISYVDHHNCDHSERQTMQAFVDRNVQDRDVPDAAAARAAVLGPWQAAAKALESDPDAPLPEVR